MYTMQRKTSFLLLCGLLFGGACTIWIVHFHSGKFASEYKVEGEQTHTADGSIEPQKNKDKYVENMRNTYPDIYKENALVSGLLYEGNSIQIPEPLRPEDKLMKFLIKNKSPQSVPLNAWITAMYIGIDWIQRPKDFKCQHIIESGGWTLCEDDFTIQKPCLIYSFGSANDFMFDDDMAKRGCEVHTFDPSMRTSNYVRPSGVKFHNIGIWSEDSDDFSPRLDIYVKQTQKWRVKTLKSIMKELGHEQRVLDVLKMDVEGYEWDIVSNINDDNLFSKVRFFNVEWHIFKDFPEWKQYPHLFKIYKNMHDIGFEKYITKMQRFSINPFDFGIQAHQSYINTRFQRKQDATTT